jgi:hypothetical protein
MVVGYPLKQNIGKKVDPENELVGKKISFTSINRPSKKGGEFAEIVPESIKQAY